MENREALIQLLSQYQQQFNFETERLQPIQQFIHACKNDQLYSRNNFTGHLTVSAFIIDEEKQNMLLLKHKVLNRWLQPGGHVDSLDDSLLEGALREVEEETGLTNKDLVIYRFPHTSVFDVDTHLIPSNPKKQEPAHLHHDIRYLSTCSSKSKDLIKAEPGTEIQWMAFETTREDQTFKDVIGKIKTYCT